MRLQGKVALVTGGAKRIGRAIVSRLAGAGYSVAIHYDRSRSEAETLAAELRAAGAACCTLAADLAGSLMTTILLLQLVGPLATQTAILGFGEATRLNRSRFHPGSSEPESE